MSFLVQLKVTLPVLTLFTRTYDLWENQNICTVAVIRKGIKAKWGRSCHRPCPTSCAPPLFTTAINAGLVEGHESRVRSVRLDPGVPATTWKIKPSEIKRTVPGNQLLPAGSRPQELHLLHNAIVSFRFTLFYWMRLLACRMSTNQVPFCKPNCSR